MYKSDRSYLEQLLSYICASNLENYHYQCVISLTQFASIEKGVLRKACDKNDLLPEAVIWRQKEQFSGTLVMSC